MSRVQTQFYGALATTQFQWATSDNDLFDRELDLYRMAQALENHDHSTGRGLPIARLANQSILTSMYGLNSIPTAALQDRSVTTPKLADGAVTDIKMDVPRTYRTGDTMTGDLRLSRAGQSNVGATFYGNGNNYLLYDGTDWTLNNNAGGKIYMIGDLWTYRPGQTQVGVLWMSAFSHYIIFDGFTFRADGNEIHHDGNRSSVPTGGMIAFRTQAELNAAGAHWVTETQAAGRLLVGQGSAVGIVGSFSENTFYGTNWIPTSTVLMSTAQVGNTGGSPNTIVVQSLTGFGTAQWVPPMYCIVWGRRV